MKAWPLHSVDNMMTQLSCDPAYKQKSQTRTQKPHQMSEPHSKSIPPPIFSDGTEDNHPNFTSPFKADGQLNYLKAYDANEPVRIMWLEKFGDELSKLQNGID